MRLLKARCGGHFYGSALTAVRPARRMWTWGTMPLSPAPGPIFGWMLRRREGIGWRMMMTTAPRRAIKFSVCCPCDLDRASVVHAAVRAPHLFRCAAAILFRAAALIVRFALAGSDGFDFAFTAAHLFR